jgi:hypothetical protein
MGRGGRSDPRSNGAHQEKHGLSNRSAAQADVLRLRKRERK